jgi:uncharacterized protein
VSTSANPQPANPHPVAPLWHTLTVIFILLAISLLSYHSRGLAGLRQPKNHIAAYLSTIAMEWVVLGFIWFGLRLRSQRLRVLLGENWRARREIARDLAIAVGFVIAANIILSALAHLLKATQNAAIRNLLPHGRTEIALYFLLTATAGICEEIIFRGYLQRQFSAGFKSTTLAVLLQGIIFGASHGYQGPKFMLIIVVYGVLFGLLAQWRLSLRPGMISHFLQDFGAGLLGAHYLK